MADGVTTQRAEYPLPAYNFRVAVGGVAMRFAKVSGLQREHQVVTYRHGLSFAEGEAITKFHMDRYVTLTLEQGAVIGSTTLHEWLERAADAATVPVAMDVSLCDEKGIPVISWSVAKAVAVKLTAPTFDARNNELCIESLEVRAAGIRVQHVG